MLKGSHVGVDRGKHTKSDPKKTKKTKKTEQQSQKQGMPREYDISSKAFEGLQY